MSKYSGLKQFLSLQKGTCIRLNFREIEDALGFPLPASARMHQVWWDNGVIEGRHSSSWLSAGWLTEEVDLAGEKVTFRKGIGPKPSQKRESERATPQSPVDLADAPTAPIALSLRMKWKHLGCVIGAGDRLRFPAAPALPGLYRFRVGGAERGGVYIGETDNLARRFQNYRTPGPSQTTNIRLNAVLRECILHGHSAELDIIAGDVHCETQGRNIEGDLSLKAVRRLLENAAILVENGEEADCLNL